MELLKTGFVRTQKDAFDSILYVVELHCFMSKVKSRNQENKPFQSLFVFRPSQEYIKCLTLMLLSLTYTVLDKISNQKGKVKVSYTCILEAYSDTAEVTSQTLIKHICSSFCRFPEIKQLWWAFTTLKPSQC